MSARGIRLVLGALWLLFLAALPLAQDADAVHAPVPDAASVASDFGRGVDAYRVGDYAAAREAWHATLAAPLDAESRARVFFDLGNAHWRAGEALPAIACYGAAVRLDPRHRDAWRNLELARAKSNLPPADAGDLGATFARLFGSLRPDEQRLLVFGALVLWVLVLIVEIRFGGGALRAALGLATLLLLVALVPWARTELTPTRHAPMCVIASGGATLRSEPLEERSAVGELAPLEEVERLDALPGWVRVEREDGTRGWARAETLYSLPIAGNG